MTEQANTPAQTEEKKELDVNVINELTAQHPQGYFYKSAIGKALMYRNAPVAPGVVTIEQDKMWRGLKLVLPTGEVIAVERLEDFVELYNVNAGDLHEDNWDEFEAKLIANSQRLKFRIDVFALAYMRDQAMTTEAPSEAPADEVEAAVETESTAAEVATADQSAEAAADAE